MPEFRRRRTYGFIRFGCKIYFKQSAFDVFFELSYGRPDRYRDAPKTTVLIALSVWRRFGEIKLRLKTTAFRVVSGCRAILEFRVFRAIQLRRCLRRTEGRAEPGEVDSVQVDSCGAKTSNWNVGKSVESRLRIDCGVAIRVEKMICRSRSNRGLTANKVSNLVSCRDKYQIGSILFVALEWKLKI